MARRVRIDVLCDVCQADEIEIEAEEIEPLTVGPKGKPLTLGLCKDHWKVWETLRDWLSEYGAPFDELPGEPGTNAPTARSTPGPEVCKICGKGYQYIGSLRTHVREKHKMTLQEMRGENAEAEQGTPPKIARAECTVDGCTSGPDGGPVVYEWPEYARPAQALGLHRRQVHGIMGETKAAKKRA